jgi:Tfp pilus assembly protein PilN
MHDINFLPVEYSERRSRRQTHPWRIVVVLAFVGLVAAAAIGQHGRRESLAADLAAVEASYELAMQHSRQLAAVHTKLQRLRSLAELYAYLEHPWPRTQLLSGVLGPLPEEVIFERVQVVREKPPAQATGERQPRSDNVTEEERLAKLPPPERDLKRIQGVCDSMRTVIHLAGTTTDSASLHRYLAELGKNTLFAKAELNSLESVPSKTNSVMRFQATVFVRPGYGQPGGPTSVPQPKRDGRLAVTLP